MTELPRPVFERLVEIFTPLMIDEDDREAIVRLGVYDSKFIGQISLSGSPKTFTINMLHKVMCFDLLILLQLIETSIKHFGGRNTQRQLQTLRLIVKAYINQPDPPTPPNNNISIFELDLETLENMNPDELRNHVERFDQITLLHIIDNIIFANNQEMYASGLKHETNRDFSNQYLDMVQTIHISQYLLVLSAIVNMSPSTTYERRSLAITDDPKQVDKLHSFKRFEYLNDMYGHVLN